jgi:uncharacterized protein YqeY
VSSSEDLSTVLQDALTTAMKARDKQRLSVVRMLLSEIRSAELADTQKPPTAQQVVAAYAKRLRKSAEEYRRLGSETRAEEAEQELAIVEEFLPKPLARDELERIIEQIIHNQGIASPQQMGRVMKLLMQEHGERVDGRIAQEIVREKLG